MLRLHRADSHAEFCCPKPIRRQFKTASFSDPSAVYLVSRRRLLAKETGFSDHLPTGVRLIASINLEEVLGGVAEIDGDYQRHMSAAGELAEEYLNSRDGSY